VKQKASRKALGETPVQLRVSREDKGKMPLNLGGIANVSREAKLISLSSPNPGALAPSANLTSTSEVTDDVANIAPVPRGTNKILSRKAEALCSAKYFSREAGTEALCSTSYLRHKAEHKAPLRAKSEVTMTSLPKSSDAKFMPSDGATRITLPSEVNKVIFKSPKNRNLKAKGLLPEPSLQVSKQDHESLVNTDLREFLTNKRKLELLHTSPSCCEQVGCS